MAPLRNQLKDLLQKFREGQQDEAVKEALAPVGPPKPSAVACNLVGYFMLHLGSCMIQPDLAEKGFRQAVRYHEFASQLAPNCVETAACHGAALLGLKYLDQAKGELERGLKMSDSDCIDPILHNVTVLADCSKGQRVEDAKQRIISDLSYIEIIRFDYVFDKVIKKLHSSRKAAEILEAGAMLVDEVKSDRAKLLFTQVCLQLLREERLEDNEKHSVLQSALETIDGLSHAHPNSLVFSLHRAKLLIALGQLSATEKECCRALRIDNPDDPRCHDTPLVSNKGWQCDGRVSLIRMQILSLLNSVVSMVRGRFEALSEEQKADFLSVEVDRLVEHYEDDEKHSANIHEALCYYKAKGQLPRVFWRCPFESGICLGGNISSNAQKLLSHIFHHLSDDEILHSAVMERLMLCDFIPDYQNSYEDLYLASDDEGCERLCFRTLDALFLQIDEVLAGNETKTNSQSSSLATFLKCITRFQSEVNNIDASNALEKAWLQILKHFAVDKCEVLMVLVATTKWEELKNVLEKQFSEEEEIKSVVDKQATDLQASGVVVQGPELLAEEHTKETGSKSIQKNHHAFMYGRRALPHKSSVVGEVSPAFPPNEGNDDPYADKAIHASFANARLNKLSHQETCTACYFERARTTKHVNQILFHLSYHHGSTGVKCPMCLIRFLTAVALSYHMYYTHNVKIMESPG